MPKPTISVTFIDVNGRRQVVAGAVGRSLMRIAVDAGLDGIAADCGGSLTCATCHVFVAAPWSERLPAVQADEGEMLEMTADPRRPDSRLSCQITLTEHLDGLEVTLPSSQY